MEKILKKILIIPLLIILLNIKNVSAETTNKYFNYAGDLGAGINSDASGFSSTPTRNVDYNFSFPIYNYNISIATWRPITINHSIIFYNNKYDFYMSFVFIGDYNIINYDSSSNNFYYCNDNIENCTSTLSKSNLNFQFLSPENTSIYDLLSNNYNFTGYKNNSSLVATSSIASSNYSNLFSNIEDFEIVYSDNLTFYIDSVSTEPEEPEDPIPEEPETPSIPSYNFSNNKYYVPNYHDGQCVEVIDKDTIRVFEDEETDFYIDYYINSNYISRQGQVDLDYIKQCSNLEFTDIRYYGNDMPQILFILVCVLTFTIGFPYILYKRFRKR